MATKNTKRKPGKSNRTLKWLKPTNPAKGMALFAVIFAVVGGTFFAFKSFAATPGGVSGSSIVLKDAQGCPYEYTKRPTLRYGSSGGCVTTLQLKLNRVNQPITISFDGNFGIQTLNGVKYFQTREGLNVDGVVGQLTWARLESYR